MIAADASGKSRRPLTLPVVLFLALLVAFLCLPTNPLLKDLDVGWLVRTGELICQTGRLPSSDVFSFSSPGRPWILYQWGFELVVGGLHRLAGMGGVVWVSAVIIALTYALILAFLLRLGLSNLSAIGLTALSMLVNLINLHARPGIFTMLLFVVILWRLEVERLSPGKYIWALPMVFLIWANFHLGFIWGLLVVFIYGVWAYTLPVPFRGPGAVKDSKLLYIFLLCLGATCLNPYGPKLFYYLWQLSQAATMNNNIQELQSPNFHHFDFIFLFIQLALLIWVRSPQFAGRQVLLTLTIIGLALGLYSTRHLAMFSIPATFYLGYALRPTMVPGPERSIPLRDFGFAAIGIVLSFCWVAWLGLKHPDFYGFDSARVPKKAIAYLKAQSHSYQKPLRVFATDPQWADYIIYTSYPRMRIFIDTRFDMYGEAFCKQFLSLRKEVLESPEVLIPLHADFLLINKNGLTAPIAEREKARLVYEDQKSLVYRLGQDSVAHR
jgi:hypothetical protein